MSLTEPAEQTDAIQKLVPVVRDWHGKALAFQVTDPESCEQAGAMVTELGRVEKNICAVFDPIVKSASDAHKVALAQRAKFLDPVKAAASRLKSVAGTWMGREAERRRIEVLEREREERAAEEEHRMQEAAALEQVGAKREAEAILEAPASVPSAPSTKELSPKVEGLTLIDNWICEITDKQAIVNSIAGGMLPLAAVEINERYFATQAKMLKNEFRGEGFVVKNVPKARKSADRGGD